MNPKISVIIPVHNTIQYLQKCLDSVCAQTLKEIEIICVNDCSTDGSTQMLHEYAAKDDRFVLIEFERNKGVSAARNAGIAKARGEFIGFVDSDDRISPDFYEKLYAAAAGGADIIKGKTKRLRADKPYDDGFVSLFDDHKKIRENVGNFCFCFFSAIYRKDFIEKYRLGFFEDLCYAEDVCFLMRAVCRANKVECVDRVYYYYVMNENSAMNMKLKDSFRFFHSELLAVDRIAEYINENQADSRVYDAQFQKIVMLVRMNTTHFSFSNDFKIQWIDHVLKKYEGNSDINIIYHNAEDEYADYTTKYKLAELRNRMSVKS